MAAVPELSDDELQLLDETFELARHGHTAELAERVDAGADPSLGGQSALEVAGLYDLPEMLALLQRPDG